MRTNLNFITLIYFIFLTLSAQAQHSTSVTFQDMNGIAAAYRCSASIISTTGQSDNDPAFVLSAGHCTADNDNATYLPDTAKIRFPITHLDEYTSYYQQLPNQPMSYGNFQLASIHYATMTTEDVTLFQATVSLGTLKSRGVRIFTLADRLPKPGEKLQLTSGLWGQTQTCTVERIITNNAEEKKLFGTSPSPLELKNTILLGADCTGRPGWSGSPLLDPKTGLIYGVASRIYTPPVGSALAGSSPRVLVSGLQELRKCLNKAGQIDLSTSGCQLPWKK